MENKILNLNQYKKSIGKSFKKGDTRVPMNTIFETIPDTIDYRLLEHILENWSLYYHKSPYSHSYYSHKVGWTYKPNQSERLSDHWDFTDKKGRRKHCQTITEDPKLNEDMWSIGVYDLNEKRYKIILSYPFIKSDENQEKKRELKQKFIKEHGSDLEDLSKEYVNKLEDQKEKSIKLNKFLTSKRNDFDIYVNGEKIDADVLNLSTSKLRYDENGEITIIRFNRSTGRSYDLKVYYNDLLILYSEDGKKQFTIPNEVLGDIYNGVLT